MHIKCYFILLLVRLHARARPRSPHPKAIGLGEMKFEYNMNPDSVTRTMAPLF